MLEQDIFGSMQSFLAAPVVEVTFAVLKWISAIVSFALLYGIIYVIIKNLQNQMKEKREKETKQQKL
ncbi:hypothetical protein HYW67_01790 [Candidatus Parcubacteria bacterium]|nr:hypothetical protein [Candidatus Parcubacteria bacterium]